MSIEQTILLVDDYAPNLVSLEVVLGDPAWTLLKANSGMEALKLLLTHDVSLVLLDVQMPEMDGFEVAAMMRKNKKTQTVPIVFLTAISKEDKYIYKGYQAGALTTCASRSTPPSCVQRLISLCSWTSRNANWNSSCSKLAPIWMPTSRARPAHPITNPELGQETARPRKRT